MDIFGRTPTVDGKARTVLGDLSEDDSPFEILQTVDQKAGDDVDRDAVVQKIRKLDESVDQKLATIEGDDVDQKEMRTAAGVIADRTRFSEEGAMDLLSAAAEAADQMDPMRFVDEFDALAADEQLDGELDQRAETNTKTSDMKNNENGTTPDDPDVDQKQENGDGQMSTLELVEEVGGSDARDTVENYAESVGKDAEECAADWISENVPGVSVEGQDDGGSDGGMPEGGDVDTAGNNPDDDPYEGDVDQMLEEKVDQKLGELNINERVADAVTAEGVLSEMAGAVAQKLSEDDELADTLVETVDQKGDFATTDDTVVTAPSEGSQTVGEAGAVTGGDDA
ncbi:hypothetical protein DVK05_09885 [Halorubrum sp. Atlit-8R]|uniref:hypothetical protein n=1 Tax=Halorubrum sp. Atlit-8R TaxID=2282126 RepID=UPI000EF23C05|nr:hypothetical protein [Halorubrum sp. Atlit-8R]RLM81297.1 hypothetical protein DVK05_09885 [Halorubrum sp. Atlit-8R]